MSDLNDVKLLFVNASFLSVVTAVIVISSVTFSSLFRNPDSFHLDLEVELGVHVVNERDQLFLGSEDAKHDILLHNLIEVNDHVVFFEICIPTVLLEEALKVRDTLVLSTNRSRGEEPELDEH
jgi:hypothetical protein